jgi:hypothetical protein
MPRRSRRLIKRKGGLGGPVGQRHPFAEGSEPSKISIVVTPQLAKQQGRSRSRSASSKHRSSHASRSSRSQSQSPRTPPWKTSDRTRSWRSSCHASVKGKALAEQNSSAQRSQAASSSSRCFGIYGTSKNKSYKGKGCLMGKSAGKNPTKGATSKSKSGRPMQPYATSSMRVRPRTPPHTKLRLRPPSGPPPSLRAAATRPRMPGPKSTLERILRPSRPCHPIGARLPAAPRVEPDCGAAGSSVMGGNRVYSYTVGGACKDTATHTSLSAVSGPILSGARFCTIANDDGESPDLPLDAPVAVRSSAAPVLVPDDIQARLLLYFKTGDDSKIGDLLAAVGQEFRHHRLAWSLPFLKHLFENWTHNGWGFGDASPFAIARSLLRAMDGVWAHIDDTGKAEIVLYCGGQAPPKLFRSIQLPTAVNARPLGQRHISVSTAGNAAACFLRLLEVCSLCR